MEYKNIAAVFATVLQGLINSRKINQKWLAGEAGTTGATICRYLKAKSQPEINIMVGIAKALNVSVDYLCGLTNLPEPKESLGPENHMLLRCYERADGRDKKIIWSILERYMTEAEKESPFSSGLDAPIN